MTAGSESRRAIVGAIVGLLYGFILTFLSIFAAGAGHGTSIPLWLSSAPLGAFGLVAWRVGASPVANYAMLLSPPLVWAVLGSLAALSKRSRVTEVLLLLQYASGLALVATTGGVLADLDVMWRDVWVTVYFVVWATVYLVGQVGLWWRIMRRNQP
jgi:hypothetical protein